MRKRVSITMSEELLKAIDEKAESKGVNRSAMIAMACSDYLKADDLMDMIRREKKYE